MSSLNPPKNIEEDSKKNTNDKTSEFHIEKYKKKIGISKFFIKIISDIRKRGL